ncbi:hypothetical protein ACFO5K_12350 [Nocardia halotolerans]|uniref:ANTAR domain-containing protein n=1 Tax=Nocardia halotolerans TaxID=1755878 RepID=A0ABV8VHU3_9NOCA
MKFLDGSYEHIKVQLDDLYDRALQSQGVRPWWEVCSTTTMSRWVRGDLRRQPREELLRPLHILAETKAGSREVLPWESHPLCTAWQGLGSVGARNGKKRRGSMKPASPVEELVADVGPVPLKKGDRPDADGIDVAWPAARLVVEYVGAGDLARVNGLIRHVGSDALPAEAVEAIISCRSIGVSDAADGIVAHAAQRKPLEVMEIAYRLLESEAGVDVSALLGGALMAAGRSLK